MNTRHEFVWGIEPPVPGHWHRRYDLGGFEVEVTANKVEARGAAEPDQKTQRLRAEAVVQNLIREIGYREKTRYAVSFGAFARFDPATNRRDIDVYAEPLSVKFGFGDNLETTLTAPDGTVVADSRQQRVQRTLTRAELMGKDGHCIA
ncbi:MAG: hypothetical protein ACE14M_10165 [Terriglobales bacterium]